MAADNVGENLGNKESEGPAEEGSFTNIFSRFCQSSTIHGTYFWSEAKSPCLRLIWILIVGMVSL